MYTEDIRAVASALVKEVREHGAPNSFSPGELYGRHDVVTPRLLGKIGRGYSDRLTKYVSEEIPGLSVSYGDHRRFVVHGKY